MVLNTLFLPICACPSVFHVHPAFLSACVIDPLSHVYCLCCSRLFGGLIGDIKRRAPWYFPSDFKDALNLQSFASIIFIYFACIAPAITFGGLMGDKTGSYMV